MAFTPTPEQQAILDNARDNVARAVLLALMKRANH